ncbi:MAG TPA: branched-chain amino acid ABC transporter permease [Acidimicrobiia bacterium]|nr:branched-chain amino acid ABC transporter permease [Acidimicrobiia bacterium]HKN91820.1 branched-chain amino acid ABC transporter permease [Acidimicrobiia bacterium]
MTSDVLPLVVGDTPAAAGVPTATAAALAAAGRQRAKLLHAAALGALVALPFFTSGYTVGVVGRILAFGVFVASLDLLVGVAGLPSLGHAAFFGVGAYTGALVARHVTALAPVQLVLAMAAGAAVAAICGAVTVRSRGVYFVMLTLAIGELVRQVAESWTSVTGGTNGLAGVPPFQVVPGGGRVVIAGYIYLYVLAVAALAYGLLLGLRASPFGQALRGLRDNEDRMRSLGYSVTGLKLAAIVAAGAAAGLAGSLWVTQARFVSPIDAGFTTSALALFTVVIGGRGSQWGSFAAAAVVVVVRDELGTIAAGRGPLLLGLTFIAVVYLLPGGAAGLLRPPQRERRWRR